MRRYLWLLGLFAFLARPRLAYPCGGCFAPPPPTPERAQVVTDHRMVLSLSQRQTTLWDQIRYTGAPEDFVWVLPVANAATLRIGLADNAFVEALDQASAPQVTGALPACFRGTSTPSPRDGSRGALFGCGSSSAFGAREPGSESTSVPRDGEATVGPYAVAVISTKSGGGRLDQWLVDHGLGIPPATQRIIDYYTELQFDFIVLRLAPGIGVQQMQPVRITTRGYSPVLPLRMVAAGVGDKVGLMLLVLAEGRMEAQGFDNVTIREADLTFDYAASRSNWRTLFADALAARRGRVWITESAQTLGAASLVYGRPVDDSDDAGVATLLDAMALPPDARGIFDMDVHPLPDDAGSFVIDAGPVRDTDADTDVLAPDPDAMTAPDDAGPRDDDAGPRDDDAGPIFEMDGMTPADAGGLAAPDAGGPTLRRERYVDRDVAFAGFAGPVVLTRMRTELWQADLERDLILDGSDAGLLPAQYVAATLLNGPACPSSQSCAVVGTATPVVMEALLVVILAMRWRQRRARRRAATGA